MNKTYSNPCIRCGTERVISRTWKEKIGNSVVINIEKVCPDIKCQNKVNQDNKKQRDKSAAMKQRSEQRALNRRTARTTH